MGARTQTLNFYTIGESYQELLYSFFTEGSFHTFEIMCKDGNFDHEQLKKCFEMKLVLTGDSRTEEGMLAHFLTESPEDFKESLRSGIRTAAAKYENDYDNVYLAIETIVKREKDKNLTTLLKYYSQEEINKLLATEILQAGGFRKTSLAKALGENKYSITGLLLQNGDFIQCADQDHRSLWPILCELDLVSGGNRGGHHDGDALVISSNQICGSVGYYLEEGSMEYAKDHKISERQLEELFKAREYHLGFYSSHTKDSVTEKVREVWVEMLNMGGKYGNLEFLKKFYPRIPLCDYSITPRLGNPGVIVRTSPNRSLPGLLNSIVLEDPAEYQGAVERIKNDFERVRDVKRGNQIHWFYQDFLEGQNGVVNCFQKPKDAQPGEMMSEEYRSKNRYDIYIACSDKQGAIVQGETGNVELGFDESRELRRVVRQLADDFKCDVQLEFVKVADNDVRIVQFRTLQNNPRLNGNPTEEELKSALIVGKTFSTGNSQGTWYNYRDIPVEDILVVEQDGESSLLLGKQALIVTNNTTFSHLLALSKALNIPSIYATGPVDFKGRERVDFSVQYVEGYVK